MKRVVIATISQETNTFSNIPTGLSEFEKQGLHRGRDAVDAMRGTGTVMGGFIDGATEFGWELVPAVRGYALPGGIVSREALDLLLGLVLDAIDANAGRLDAVLLELHGATVVEGEDDAEGFILEQVRRRIGRAIPLVCSLDLHANVSARMLANADVLNGYDTYPHVDFYDRGRECAAILERIFAGDLRPVSRHARPPLLAPLQTMVTSTPGNPMARLVRAAHELERDPKVVDISVFGGFPYADVADAGFSVIATTNGDPQLAEQLARAIAGDAWAMRDEWDVHPVPPDAAIGEAMAADGGTFILADIADSQGGGTAGDGTEILRALIRNRAKSAAVAQIADPDAVRRCIAAGVGSTVTLDVGGKFDDRHGAPVTVTGYVRLISDGRFVRGGSWQPGTTQVMGRTVVLDCDGIEVMLTEFRTHPTNLEHFRSQGIEPTQRRILVLKGAAHYRAEFEPIARKVIEVDAPGITHPDLTRFPFRKVRRPIHPLDPVAREPLAATALASSR